MNYKLTVGWLYPDLMSTYGDRGNIIVLRKRCEWRGIQLNILRIETDTNTIEIKNCDIIFGGGAQDREQEIVMRDLHGSKGKVIKELIEKFIPSLFVCGAPQLMGKYYEPGEGKRIEGLGIFDMVTKHPGPTDDRLIGNIVAKAKLPDLNTTIVGFENHGGRTYLQNGTKPFAKVIKGYGNNGKDDTEGVVYKNTIGCYFHGPLLPKNPEIADWIISKAIEVKYNECVKLKPLVDSLEQKGKRAIANRLKLRL